MKFFVLIISKTTLSLTMTATLTYTLILAVIFVGKKMADYMNQHFKTYP
jgi:hypothetical protein